MKNVKIGINNLHSIYLQLYDDTLRIDDECNDGVIECTLGNLNKTIQIIKDVYKQHNDLPREVYGHGRETVQLGYYQTMIRKKVFRGNYIIINHMPDIIKMLKSVKIEKEKYILNKDSLYALSINDLVYLKHTMRRRKKVMIDNNGEKYIEV